MRACVAATLSANGTILVLNQLGFNDPDETHVRKVRTSTFQVLKRYVDVNESLRVNGPEAYWADPLWSLVFQDDGKTQPMACPYTLVTNDGEFLVLLGDYFGSAALSVYRRRDHPGHPFGGPGPDHGVLVRQFALKELWPREQIPTMISDHTPQWYSRGAFAFSPDDRTLLYKTPWGATIRISLSTGDITQS